MSRLPEGYTRATDETSKIRWLNLKKDESISGGIAWAAIVAGVETR